VVRDVLGDDRARANERVAADVWPQTMVQFARGWRPASRASRDTRPSATHGCVD
jgi:hypothetical protein